MPGFRVQALGATYGFANAPREFLKLVEREVLDCGFKQALLERCAWLCSGPGAHKAVGAIGCRVAGFLIVDPGKARRTLKENLKRSTTWGADWKKSSFTFAGVGLRRFATGPIRVHQIRSAKLAKETSR